MSTAKAKLRRRDGSQDMLDFYDTYNPRYNKVANARRPNPVAHIDWPVSHPKLAPMLHAYTVRKPALETRTPFLTELSPFL